MRALVAGVHMANEYIPAGTFFITNCPLASVLPFGELRVKEIIGASGVGPGVTVAKKTKILLIGFPSVSSRTPRIAPADGLTIVSCTCNGKAAFTVGPSSVGSGYAVVAVNGSG
jgi:hypothetical protein